MVHLGVGPRRRVSLGEVVQDEVLGSRRHGRLHRHGGRGVSELAGLVAQAVVVGGFVDDHVAISVGVVGLSVFAE